MKYERESMVNTICRILHIGKSTYYKYKKDDLAIIRFLHSFSKEDLLEIEQTGTTKSFELAKEIRYQEYRVLDKLSNFDSIQKNMLLNILHDFYTIERALNINIDRFKFFIRINDLNKYFPEKLQNLFLEQRSTEKTESFINKLEHANQIKIRQILDFLFELNELEILVLLSDYEKILEPKNENGKMTMSFYGHISSI